MPKVILIEKALDFSKLVKTPVTVRMDGKVYQSYRYKRPSQSEPPKKEPKKSGPEVLRGNFSESKTVTQGDLTKIQAIIRGKNWDMPYVGIRVVDDDYDGYDSGVGDILKPSSRWDDGEYTDEKLNGTSAIDIDARLDPSSRGAAYMGRRILIVGSKDREWGEDAGEVVLPNAMVLAVYDLSAQAVAEKQDKNGGYFLGDDGKPLTVYHGTAADFNKFDELKIGNKTDGGRLGRGFYFSTDPQVARSSPRIVEAKLKIKNPLIISFPTWESDKKKLITKKLNISDQSNSKEIGAALQLAGYDAVILDYSPVGYNHKEIMVPDAEQIEVQSNSIRKSLTFSGFPLQGRRKVHGMDISIENRKGSTRRGTDKDGHEWAVKMHAAYGRIRGTVGKDGDLLDCYVGPNPESMKVFVIHQNDPATGKYDEDKTMLGFDSAEEAKALYMKQYDRPGFFGSMDETDIETFKEKAFADSNKGKKLIVKAIGARKAEGSGRLITVSRQRLEEIIERRYPDELAVGIKVEMEHTDDPAEARKIAFDHLIENHDYYKKLIASGLVDEDEAIEEAEKRGLKKSIRLVVAAPRRKQKKDLREPIKITIWALQ